MFNSELIDLVPSWHSVIVLSCCCVVVLKGRGQRGVHNMCVGVGVSVSGSGSGSEYEEIDCV